WLRQTIGGHRIGRDIFQTNAPALDFVPDVVVDDVNVLSPVMVDRVFCERFGALAVRVDQEPGVL
ncbi:MAG: hypothetical protein Q9226_008945, partial [Calogaya cf. arnoldii]